MCRKIWCDEEFWKVFIFLGEIKQGLGIKADEMGQYWGPWAVTWSLKKNIIT